MSDDLPELRKLGATGGSLRNQNPEDVEGLCRRGLVDDEQNLSVPGLLALTLAMRRQQTDALRRAEDIR
jgi:hypothetical protein